MILKRIKLVPVLFLLPSLLFLGVFVYIPIVQNFFNSFFDFSVFSQTKEFIGFSYFKELFEDKILMTSFADRKSVV